MGQGKPNSHNYRTTVAHPNVTEKGLGPQTGNVVLKNSYQKYTLVTPLLSIKLDFSCIYKR